MKLQFSFVAAILLVSMSIAAAQPAAAPAPVAGRAARPPAPTRDPLTPGFVKATELPDGQVPPREADGNFIIGPTHVPASEMINPDLPSNRVTLFSGVLRRREGRISLFCTMIFRRRIQ